MHLGIFFSYKQNSAIICIHQLFGIQHISIQVQPEPDAHEYSCSSAQEKLWSAQGHLVFICS